MIKIRKKIYCFVFLLLSSFGLLAEEKKKAADRQYNALWENAYKMQVNNWGFGSEIKEYEDEVIRLLDEYDFIKSKYHFLSALNYAVEEGSFDVIDAFIRYGLTEEEIQKAVKEAVSSYKRLRDLGSDREASIKQELTIRRILSTSKFDGLTEFGSDVFLALIESSSLELIDYFRRYQFSQKVIDEALKRLASQMYDDLDGVKPSEVAGKVDVLMSMTEKPSIDAMVEVVTKAKEENKFHIVIEKMLKNMEQPIFDQMQNHVMGILKADKFAREYFHNSGLVFKPGDEGDTILESVWKERTKPDWQDWFIFVVNHYQRGDHFVDELVIKSALTTGSEEVVKAVSSLKGAEGIFAEVFPERLDSLIQSKKINDKAGYEEYKGIVKWIIGGALQVDTSKHLDALLSLADKELTKTTIARLSSEQLVQHQGILIKHVDQNALRSVLVDQSFIFSADSDALNVVLSHYEQDTAESNKSKLSFVVQNYQFTGSDSDQNAVKKLQQLAPELVRDGLAGGLGSPMQQVAFQVFENSLRQYKASLSSLMLTTPEDFARLPVPIEGFEAFICSLINVKDYPEDPQQTFSMIRQWMQAANHDLDTAQLQACAFGDRRQVSRMPLAPFSFVFSLLHHYRWAVDVTVARHVKAKVLNHVGDIMELMSKETGHSLYKELFPLTRWLEGQVDGGVTVSDRNISAAMDLHWVTFQDWKDKQALESFVDYILSLYPDETYEKYLKFIYRSENVEFLAYVLSNPGHLTQLQKHVNKVLKAYLDDFEEPVLQRRTSLLLMHCVVPQSTENPIVATVVQHCEATSDNAVGDVSSSETCRFCDLEDDSCQLVLATPLDDSTKSILKRIFLSKPVLPEQTKR